MTSDLVEAPSVSDAKVFRVGSGTEAKALGSAITHALQHRDEVALRAVGANAVNRAVKATAIARGFMAQRGSDLCVVPSFTTVPLRDIEGTAVVLVVRRMQPKLGSGTHVGLTEPASARDDILPS